MTGEAFVNHRYRVELPAVTLRLMHGSATRWRARG